MALLPLLKMPSDLVDAIRTRVTAGPLGRIVARLAPITARLTPLLTRLGLYDHGNEFILNIGDEGATLVQVRAGQVVDAIFAEAAAEEGWDALREMLRADARAPIILVADVLEQMFREDTVPKVGFFDRAKIVKRRLDLTFPNDLLKAALRHPQQRGASQSVLFTALPMSAHLDRWVAFLDEFPNPLRGFYMLPLEAVGVAARLAPSAEGEHRRVWRALISQEAASGFRQVFDARGKLMVTRLTQRAAQPLTPEAEAMLIERELRSSISYVKRLGFSDTDRLDVVVLASPAVCRAVGERDLPAATLTTYTPYQAGVMLGVGEVGREDTPFADVLLGLWIAKKRRPTLALPSPRIARQMRMTSIIRWSAAAAAFLTIFGIYQIASLATDYLSSSGEISALEGQVTTSQNRLATELERMKNYPIPLDELTQVAQTEETLTNAEISLGELARKIAAAMADDGRISSFSYALSREPVQAAPRPEPNAEAKTSAAAKVLPYEIHLVVNLAAEAAPNPDSQAPLQHAKSILTRLASAFPGYEVEATKLPGALMVNQLLEGSSAVPEQGHAAGPPVPTAEYVIRKAA